MQYKEPSESSYPVSAIAERAGLCPRLVVNYYWALCQRREKGTEGTINESNRYWGLLCEATTNKTKAWRVHEDLLKVAAKYRPVRM